MQGQADSQAFPREACERFSAELAAYLDGSQRPEVLSHAASCEFCQSVLADVQLIRSASSSLMLEDPPARVWSNVRSVLQQEGIIRPPAGFWKRIGISGPLRWPAPVAAAVAAAVMVVLFKFPGVLVRPAPAPESAVAVAQSYTEPADLVSLRQSVQQLEQAYQANASLLEPSLKTTYQRSLRSLDQEIRECQSSMRQEPQDGLAREYLSSAYFQKAQLLRSALDYNLR